MAQLTSGRTSAEDLVGVLADRGLWSKLDSRSRKAVLDALRKSRPDDVGAALIKRKLADWVNDPVRNRAVLVQKGTGCAIQVTPSKPISRLRKRTYPITPPVDQASFLRHAQTSEGVVRHMYLDTKGNVTVGKGHMIPNAPAARAFSFRYKDSHENAGQPAGAAAIERDYHRVKNSGLTNHNPSAFRPLTDLDLSVSDIDRLYEDDVKSTLAQLKAKGAFPDFNTYPPTAKLGLLDMAFNAGVGGLLTIFKNFTPAVRRRDWKLAAAESNRSDVSGERNSTVRQWFIQAARSQPFFLSASCKKTLEQLFK